MIIHYILHDSINFDSLSRALLVLNLSIEGILLFLIRLMDPLVLKSIKKSIIKQKQQQLKEKLLIKNDN